MQVLVSILVLYNQRLDECLTYCSLKEAIRTTDVKLKLLVYDNSPSSQIVLNNEDNIEITYVSDVSNSGLSKAYNTGIQFAVSNHSNWLLLLDQDTHLTKNFMNKIFECVNANVLHEKQLACYVPIITSPENDIISPTILLCGGFTLKRKNWSKGISKHKNLSAINSGSLVNIKYLNEIGGYSNKYPLDMLDHWFFRTLKTNNKNVFIIDSFLMHHLSVESQEYISEKRYLSIIESELIFYAETNNKNLIFYLIRIIFRINKHLLKRRFTFIKYDVCTLGKGMRLLLAPNFK